jgi:hypothetical protein
MMPPGDKAVSFYATAGVKGRQVDGEEVRMQNAECRMQKSECPPAEGFYFCILISYF